MLIVMAPEDGVVFIDRVFHQSLFSGMNRGIDTLKDGGIGVWLRGGGTGENRNKEKRGKES
jgi:hypothetical protein